MPRTFYKVNIEISNLCNLQCSFCPEVERPKALMDLALFERVLEQVKPHTELVCLHLMGEPLIHPKLSQFVEACFERNLQIFLVTNGVPLKERDHRLLLHPAFRQVNFSLHSFADNFGDKDPTDYLENIFRFTELAFAHRPSLFINYRLWNLKEIRGKQNANLNILERIEKRFGIEIPRDFNLHEQKSVKVKNLLSLHYDTEFIWPDLSLPVLGTQGTCQGLSSHFGVLVDGTVVPCCLDKEGKIPLGNLKEAPLSDILGSHKAQSILKGFKTQQLIEPLCQRCQYITRFESRLSTS